MYEIFIGALICTGLVASGFFVLTWTPLAIKAKHFGRMPYSAIELIDFAGLQVGIFILYILAVYNLSMHGVQAAPDGSVKASRIMTTLLFNLIAYLRVWRWVKELKRRRNGEPAKLAPPRDASSEHRDAMEGKNERDRSTEPRPL